MPLEEGKPARRFGTSKVVALALFDGGRASLRMEIWLTASLSSFKVEPRLISWGLLLLLSSSSLPGMESGGEMTAPFGMPLSSVTGGGDWRTLTLVTRALKSAQVLGGVGELVSPPTAGGVRRFLVRYDADRGSCGREPLWKDGRRLTSGEEWVELAGDRVLEGGV